MREQREGDIELWWPTPVFIHRWPGNERLNPQLEALIREKMAASDGRQRSNVGGWHSEEDLMAWPSPAIALLKNQIERGVAEIIRESVGPHAVPPRFAITAWANVNKAGDSNDAHDHGNHAWAGVYYVATGNSDPDAPSSGPLELLDPRVGATRIHLPSGQFSAARLLRPTPGTMVIFPAWLWHSVRPHADPGLRISVAFNVAEARTG